MRRSREETRRKTKAQLVKELEETRRLLDGLKRAEADCRQAGEALRESRNVAQTIINGIGDPVLVIDISNFNIVIANEAAKRKTGIKDTLERPLTCYRAVHHRDRPCEAPEEPCPLSEVVSTGAPARVTHLHRDSRNNDLYVDIIATPVFNATGEVVQIIESCRDITEFKRLEEERVRLIAELQDALGKIKTLKGLIPVCAWCKKVRNDKRYWDDIEDYIRKHSDADFTHGICPECIKRIEEGEAD